MRARPVSIHREIFAFSTGYAQAYGFSAALTYATITCFYMMTGTLLSVATLAQPEGLVPFATIGAWPPCKKLRFSNRKSGIRIWPKSQRISFLQISNRKYFAMSGEVYGCDESL